LQEQNLNKNFGCCKKLCMNNKIFLLACVFESICYNITLKLQSIFIKMFQSYQIVCINLKKFQVYFLHSCS
jgi:hypothetical protein